LLHQETARFWTCRSLGYAPVLLAPAALNKATLERQKALGMWLHSHLAVCSAIASTRGLSGDAIDLFECLLREICFGSFGQSTIDDGDDGRTDGDDGRTMRGWWTGFRRRSGILRGRENPFDPRIAPLQHGVIGALLADVERGLGIAEMSFREYYSRRAALARWLKTRDAQARRLVTDHDGRTYFQAPGAGDRCRRDLTPTVELFSPAVVEALAAASRFPIHPVHQAAFVAQFGVPDAVRVVAAKPPPETPIPYLDHRSDAL
jgi:hypothetical protein